ncbi:hypothetical protein ABZX40_38495 [Streptomyces sp. NPDC004610]|uniref:hypothetical protein n=1 Tax=unclassified Streptomyces TaxID=2593676 RepID=UPI0033AD2A22
MLPDTPPGPPHCGKGTARRSGPFRWCSSSRTRSGSAATTSGPCWPWPSATTIGLGLGLLNALGRTPTVRHHLHNGEPPHPTQHPAVTHALTTSTSPGPLYAPDGRERKAQLWPHQLQRWFHLALTTHATADRILQTRINPATHAPRTPPPAQPGHDVFITGPTDRYPDLFDLAQHHNTPTRHQILRHLRTLPRHSLALSHQPSTNSTLIHRMSTTAPGA